MGNATTYDYDLAGRLRAVHYPGTNRVLHVDWNQVDEPTELWDNLGSLTLRFNHQGLWTGASNSFGLWRQTDYDLNSRPTNVIVAGGQRAALEYDSVGRVLRREMVTTNGSSVESFGYTMNVAGATAYTNQLGTGITLLTYNLIGRTNHGFGQVFTLTNSFNQLDRVTCGGTFTAAGLVQSATNVTVTVKVNAEGSGTNATVYADKSFARSGITVTSGTNTFTVVATDSNGRLATNAASAWLPTTASFVYDRNGNLSSDGRRGFSYDDFDQLTSVTVTNAWRSEFKYDPLGRRRARTEKLWRNGAWAVASETRHVYDPAMRGW